jgi:cell division protein FtsB
VDPQIVDLIKALIAPVITGGGVVGWYVLYRKFDAERAASLREDNKTLRDENKELREEIRKLRDELRGDDA